MSFLLDVNVLIARSDPRHESHAAVRAWFSTVGNEPLLFCPLVENGFLRIFGHSGYPGGPGTPAAAREDLAVMRALPNARLIPDDVSVLDSGLFGSLEELTPRQLTDVYLLGLSVSRGALFATLDTRVPSRTVRDGVDALVIIPQDPAPN
ncbi:MAG: TA system VapC family ribonuclease toxin [Spirochaetales bacterium]